MRYTIRDGWLQQARRVASPNFGPRPDNCEPELLVVHNISLPPGCYDGDCVEQLFTNCLDWDAHPFFDEIRGLEVSSHVLIRRSGELVQFVSFEDRAWHAGESSWRGRHNCNDFSIGVELEGADEEPYADAQYPVLADLTRTLIATYPRLHRHGITGHSDIAPGRKTDPGPAFDWLRYLLAL
ncbi:MAG: 1,6-anhydro-N-acetylmuramyl-L-alanine amidase AmpD [Halioglobus sp.]|nr:1,6-anhydro-N-acetylmuramyl-L-alanine amidase AmpD [Halioglobus sp.]